MRALACIFVCFQIPAHTGLNELIETDFDTDNASKSTETLHVGNDDAFCWTIPGSIYPRCLQE